MTAPTPGKTKTAEVYSLNDLRTLRVDLSRGTIQEAWDLYQASLALDALRPASRLVYKQAAREAIAGLPARPTAGDVRLWLERLATERAPATINKLLRALKSIVERATLVQRAGNLQLRNAFKGQRPFRLPARERRDASAATVQRLLELAANPIERIALRLAAFYGLRVGELLGLQPGDVRTDGGAMRIRVIRTRDKDGVGPRKNALNGKPHVLNVEGDGETQGIVLALCDYETRREFVHPHQRRLAAEWLIPWGPAHADKLMNRWRTDERVELPKGDAWHPLRHFGATSLAKQGATLTEIQAWLGDSTPTAAQTYMGQVRGTTVGTSARVLRAFNSERSDESCRCGGGVTSNADQTLRATPPRTKSDPSSSHEFYTT